MTTWFTTVRASIGHLEFGTNSSETNELPERPSSEMEPNFRNVPDGGVQSFSERPETSENSKYSKEALEEYRQMFAVFDTRNAGSIGMEDLKESMARLGLQVNSTELETLLLEIDQDGNGEIDFDEFCTVMNRFTKRKVTWDEIIKQCFEVFDQVKYFSRAKQTMSFVQLKQMPHFVKSGKYCTCIIIKKTSRYDSAVVELSHGDGEEFLLKHQTGVVSEADFRTILKTLGEIVDDDILDQIFQEVDVDGNGVIDYNEFSSMVRNYMKDDDVESLNR